MAPFLFGLDVSLSDPMTTVIPSSTSTLISTSSSPLTLLHQDFATFGSRNTFHGISGLQFN
jgi:hypothetical protein